MINHDSGNFLDLGDARIYYEVAGPPEGHPVVLLHGGLGSLEDFSPVASGLADAFRIIAVDMRGHGKSSLGEKPLTYQQHQADIQALIANLSLENYSLVGFSDGGIVAYRLATSSPSVSALVTIGAQWRISQQDPSFEILGGVTPGVWAEMFPEAPKKYSILNPGGDFNTLVTSCVSLWTDLSSTGYPRDSISGIECPTLLLRGDSDFLLSLSEIIEAQSKIPGSSLGNIPFAGHAAMEDSPEIIGKLIHDFLLSPTKVQTEA